MITCKICGKEEDPSNWINESEMREHQMCFSCNCWRNRLEEDSKLPPHTAAMIDGTHYIIGSEDDKSYFRGFGGHRFEILFNDGTRIITTNLWCQGEPSKEWVDKFPNNAKFVDNLKWTKIGETNYLTT